MDTIYDLVRFAQKTQYEDIPQEAIHSAKMLLKDVLGVIVPGTTADMSQEVTKMMLDWSGKEESSVMVFNKKLPAHHAAFANSLLAHARDYDEVMADAIVHTGVSVIPTTLAVAEAMGGINGKKILSTIALTDELFIRMGLSIKASIMESGWIYSPLVGHFASAYCSSLLMGLDEDKMINALGIVYSQAAGNQQASTDTSLTKRMQPAFAARSGVFSAYLARLGVTGARNIFDGDYSFYHVYLNDRCDKSILTKDLGKEYMIPQLSFKPYPVCGLAMGGAGTALEIVQKNNIKIEEITGIDLGVTRQTKAIVVVPEEVKFNPKTVVDAQFSLPYSVACILNRGHLLLGDVSMDGIKDEKTLALMKKIKIHIDEELDAKYSRGVAPTRVTIHTNRGDFTDCTFPKGHPSNPFTDEDMKNKFMDAMQYGIYPVKAGAAEKILDMVDHLEDVENFNELIDLYNNSFVR